MKEFIEAFKALRHAPRALWMVIFAFTFDAMAYFGILPLMKKFLGDDIHVAPRFASMWVSVFTGALTIFMLFVGKPVEGRLGIRRGILLALSLAIVGRILYVGAPFTAGLFAIAPALLVVAVAEAILQPVCYAGVKKYTDEKTGPMGFAMLYAGLNLGAMLIGPISAGVRTTWDKKHAAGMSAFSGINAVNLTCLFVTVGCLLGFFLFMTPSVESKIVRNTDAPADGKGAAPGRLPIFDARFMFFIFALLPVRTLFAHQWLTMPEYVLYCYPPAVQDRMEWLVESANPLIIFFGVPTITAITRRFHVLTMMIIGSFVSASSTFLLCTGTRTSTLILYFVLFSIGEALWSSRFLEYAAELAPPGRVAQYMGIANLPWFVAKATTGIYSGIVLERFVPKEGPKSPETMWLLYGLIAMASPVLLLLARKWVLAGMKPTGKLVTS